MSEEIQNSIKDNIKERISSPFYGTYFISWLIFHWQIIIVLFFVDEDYIWQTNQLMKNEFILKYFVDYADFWFWFRWITPFILTILIIWVFPKYISIPAFKKSQKDNSLKEIFKLQEKIKIEEEENELRNKKILKLEKEKEIIKKEKDIEQIDPELNWEKEYKNFREMPYYIQFKYIITSVYSHNGNTSWSEGLNLGINKIPEEVLAFAHSSGLINFTKDGKSRIELTEKGKYFVKMYNNDSKNKGIKINKF